MDYKPILLALAAETALGALVTRFPSISPAWVLFSSLLALESVGGFETVAQRLSKAEHKVMAPAVIMGKSGVKHEFALAVFDKVGKPSFVVDTELSVNEVDEMKVLKFYVKVFDVSPAKALFCVSPSLSPKAHRLAGEYKIGVLEDEVPRRLVEMAAHEVEEFIGRKGS